MVGLKVSLESQFIERQLCENESDRTHKYCNVIDMTDDLGLLIEF